MEIRITGEINDTENIVKLIESAVADIDLYINSPGGDVFAGLNVVNAIQKSKVQVTAHVEVMAASIAGVIALACDKVEIDKNSLIMLHNCWTVSSGNKKALEQDIKAMEAIDNILHNIISENSTDLNAQIEEGDVWLTGEEVAEIFTNAELIEIKKDYALCAYSSLVNLVKENKKLKSEQEEEEKEEEQPEETEEEPKQEEKEKEQPEEEKEQEEEEKKEDYKVSDRLKDLLEKAGGI